MATSGMSITSALRRCEGRFRACSIYIYISISDGYGVDRWIGLEFGAAADLYRNTLLTLRCRSSFPWILLVHSSNTTVITSKKRLTRILLN